MSQRGPGPIPNRWLYCPRKSDSIIAERFLAFKTPLSKAFNDQMPMECIFQPQMIFDYCKTQKLKLGLWIDLTNTKRFYDRSVIEEQGATYIKLQCRGHGETPSPEQTRSFIEIVDNFINEHPFEIIGVHCTHGFNRTGFLITSFLVERLDCSVEAALSLFTNARMPGIYKQDYINELFRRYEDEEDAPQAPELPEWCLEYDDSNGNDDIAHSSGSRKRQFDYNHDKSSTSSQAAAGNGGAGLFDDDGVSQEGEDADDQGDEATGSNGAVGEDGAQPAKKRRREMIIKDAAFMEGVPGVTQVTDQPRLGALQYRVQEMCGWNKNGFPGAQPVSMDQKNIKRLHEIPYRVSWKADGSRYMMLIHKRDEIYFFDRNHSCFQVENLTFLKAGNLNEHLEDTLLDGEMVLDELNGQITPRYLIYDIVTLADNNVGQKPFFPNRLHYIKKEIIAPRHEAIGRGKINRSLEPFGVRNKEFWDIRQSASLLGDKFARSLLHKPDGLIFQPSEQPYTPGVCSDVFKWKPHDMNSIDFRLKIIVERGQGILPQKIGLLYVGGQDSPFGRLFKLTKTTRELDNKIIECTAKGPGSWEFMRERTDKKMPNSYKTAYSVLESIKNPVTKEILLDYIADYGYRDDQDMMPPPSSTHHLQRRHH